MNAKRGTVVKKSDQNRAATFTVSVVTRPEKSASAASPECWRRCKSLQGSERFEPLSRKREERLLTSKSNSSQLIPMWKHRGATSPSAHFCFPNNRAVHTDSPVTDAIWDKDSPSKLTRSSSWLTWYFTMAWSLNSHRLAEHFIRNTCTPVNHVGVQLANHVALEQGIQLH